MRTCVHPCTQAPACPSYSGRPRERTMTTQGLAAIRLPPSSTPKVVVVQSLTNRVHVTRSGPQGPMRRCKKDMPPPPMTLVTVCAGLCFTMRGHYHPTVQRELQREGERTPHTPTAAITGFFCACAQARTHTDSSTSECQAKSIGWWDGVRGDNLCCFTLMQTCV